MKDAYSSITTHWHGGKPELPDSLKDVSTVIIFEEMKNDPDNIRYDCGWRCKIGHPHRPPSQRDYV